MPKITVHGGPTNAAAGAAITGGGWGDPLEVPAPVEPSPVEQTGDERPNLYDPENLTYPEGGGDPYTLGTDGTRYFEPKTLEDDGESVTASVAVTPPPGGTLDDAIVATVEETDPVDYETFTVGQLRELLADRTLPVSGTKPELIARLVEDDETAAKATDES